MNCREAEKRIYLYKELTEIERQEVDQHLKSCSGCNQAFDRMKSLQTILNTQKADIPPLPNEAAMTRRILEAVSKVQKEKSSVLRTFFSVPIIKPLRYGMAGLSLLLILTFLGEYLSDDQFSDPEKHYRVPGKRMELNTASFHDAFLISRGKKDRSASMLYECAVNCLRAKQADCSDCTKFTKN